MTESVLRVAKYLICSILHKTMGFNFQYKCRVGSILPMLSPIAISRVSAAKLS